jgi:hypothetical protein
VKITSIFDNFRIFGVDSTHNKLRDQLTSAQRNIVGTNIKNIILSMNLEILARGTCLTTVIPAN